MEGGENEMAKTILGLFTQNADSENVISELKNDGYPVEDISIIINNSQRTEDAARPTMTHTAAETTSGVVTGAVLGVLAGLVSATVLPGIGAIFIGGPIATALGLGGAAALATSGAVTGAVAGGLIGALVSLGLPREDAAYYEERIKQGATLLAVPVTSRTQENYVSDIFDEYNASDIRVVNTDIQEEEYTTPRREEGEAHFAHLGAKGGRTRRKREAS